MNTLAKKILFAFTVTLLLISLTACGGGYNASKACYIDDKSPAKRFITDNGTERYYCKEHVTKCTICDKKATKNYTNLLDFHVFVCDEHYSSFTED